MSSLAVSLAGVHRCRNRTGKRKIRLRDLPLVLDDFFSVVTPLVLYELLYYYSF